MFSEIFSRSCHALLRTPPNNPPPVRNLYETHYDILHLDRDCTSKEVKAAYRKLSMIYHPDKTKNLMLQKTFVKIVEAYNILSKPDTRQSYDIGLALMNQLANRNGLTAVYSSCQISQTSFCDPLFWANKDKLRVTYDFDLSDIEKLKSQYARTDIQNEAINCCYKARLQRLMERKKENTCISKRMNAKK